MPLGNLSPLSMQPSTLQSLQDRAGLAYHSLSISLTFLAYGFLISGALCKQIPARFRVILLSGRLYCYPAKSSHPSSTQTAFASTMSSSSSIHRTLPFPVDQLLILPLTSSDFLSAAQTAGAAFGYDENPFRTFVSPPSLRPKTDPNNEFYHSHTAARWKMDYFGEETKQHHMCLKIVRKGEEENVLGAAFWGLPGGPYRKIDTSDYTAEEKEAWTDIDVDHWNTLMGAYYNAKQEVMKDQAGNCLYVSSGSISLLPIAWLLLNIPPVPIQPS